MLVTLWLLAVAVAVVNHLPTLARVAVVRVDIEQTQHL
jgi:hypothetical protein